MRTASPGFPNCSVLTSVSSELSSLPWGKFPADSRRKYMGCCCSAWRPQCQFSPADKVGCGRLFTRLEYEYLAVYCTFPDWTAVLSMWSPIPIAALTILLNPISHPRGTMLIYERKQNRLRTPRDEPTFWPIPAWHFGQRLKPVKVFGWISSNHSVVPTNYIMAWLILPQAKSATHVPALCPKQSSYEDVGDDHWIDHPLWTIVSAIWSREELNNISRCELLWPLSLWLWCFRNLPCVQYTHWWLISDNTRGPGGDREANIPNPGSLRQRDTAGTRLPVWHCWLNGLESVTPKLTQLAIS